MCIWVSVAVRNTHWLPDLAKGITDTRDITYSEALERVCMILRGAPLVFKRGSVPQLSLDSMVVQYTLEPDCLGSNPRSAIY